jgi:uncharacterized cupin superfamily protein
MYKTWTKPLGDCLSFSVLSVFIAFPLTVLPAEVLKPTKISRNDSVLLATSDVKNDNTEGLASKVRVVSRSADKRFEAGVNSTEKKVVEIKSYPVDEFMMFVDGTATFTSADGTVIEGKKDDAVFIPKGWRGRMDTQGFREFYVVYSLPESASGGAAAPGLHPVKISTKDPSALQSADVKTFQMFTYRVMGKSADKSFRAGLSSMGIKRSLEEKGTNVDEVLFLISGGETFTNPDGTVVAAKAGDTVFMPKGWAGHYDTGGYEEFYAIYGPECMATKSC